MGKLNFLGIGPKIGVVLLPWLAATIIFSSIHKGLFIYSPGNGNILLISGIILMTFGLGLYFLTVRLLLKGLKETRLVTNGPYNLCRNPLYSSIILFIIPALSLILNSWLILTSGFIGYILFKLYIKKEYNELENFFGDNYIKYKNDTPEFFPLPLKKWFS
jgi:protein-S-isoprenylcysteine O-methyltransferase Ste14